MIDLDLSNDQGKSFDFKKQFGDKKTLRGLNLTNNSLVTLSIKLERSL